MKEIKIKISNDKARLIHYYLCRKYNKSKNANLNNLCLIAIWKEVQSQAEKELKEGIE